MKHALAFSWLGLLAACAVASEKQTADGAVAPLWRYRMKAQPDGSRMAVAVDAQGGREEALPQDLWCPHGAWIDLERDAAGKVVGAVSKAEPADAMPGGKNLPAFALAPAESQNVPWVVLRCQISAARVDWAVLDRAHEGRVTRLGPWQIEHIQFQRMERPGPGLENCVLLTFQAGEGSHHAVVKVEVGEKGAKLRPRTGQDAEILRRFLGRATPAEKVVVEKVLAE